MQDSDVYTVKEAAKQLKIGERTLWRILSDRKIEYFEAQGSKRFTGKMIREYIERQTQKIAEQ